MKLHRHGRQGRLSLRRFTKHLKRQIISQRKEEWIHTMMTDEEEEAAEAEVEEGEDGFVKKGTVTGRWYDVGEGVAREKIGQGLRERLHVKYKSSTKSKRRKLKEEAANKEKKQRISSMKQSKESLIDDMVYTLSIQMKNTLSFTLKEILGNGTKDDPVRKIRQRNDIGKYIPPRTIEANNTVSSAVQYS